VARLVDLALIPARTRRLIGGKGSATKGGREDGKGWSRVRTARGDLLHAAALSDGKVLRYAIVQPTRWNFDGRGAAARCLADLAAAGTAVSRRRRAELLIDALDPCVAYDLRID
jgi:Ni,Fe-hydrogenase I large subunit